VLWLSILLSLACMPMLRAQNIEGQIIAAQYGTWRVQGIPQPAAGNGFDFVAASCTQIAGNKSFQAFQVGTPIEIIDADPSQNESVTPSVVSATNQGCSITVAPAHTHHSFSLGSATAGLQEALNANLNSVGNTIVLTAKWYELGGSSAIIASVHGSTALKLVDVTKAPYDWYTWNGSQYVKVAIGGGTLPNAQTLIGGKGDGNGVAMPEKGITVNGSNGSMAWDEDIANGRFDCRNTAYAGGCLGATPGAAMQAFSDALVCYQAITGKHARTSFPPGTISVGTTAQPTLKLPTGAIYEGVGGWGFGTDATRFQATYNGHGAVEFDNNLTSTTNCSDGVPHTSNMGGGSYDGFSEHGCGQGGCVNVSGDLGNYPFGGPQQTGIVINDADATVGKKAGVFANNNGADGVIVGGQDSHTYEIGGANNNTYFYFGLDVAGQNYQFSSDQECHADAVLGGLDNMNEGPVEVYGTTMTLGWEYGHIGGICLGGGNVSLGTYFSQIEEIGLIMAGAGGTQRVRVQPGRIDAPRGDGIRVINGGHTTFVNPVVISACRADGLNDYVVYSVTTATPGSAQTPGTYLLTASTGSAQISVTVASDGTVSTNPTVTVHGRSYTSTAPTFTLAAGGTPATFTVTMKNVFDLRGISDVTAGVCDYFSDSAGNDTYVSPLAVSDGFFGADHSTGDLFQSSGANTWIAARGNLSNGKAIWDPQPSSEWTAHGQYIIDSDSVTNNNGVPVTGSALNLSVTGAHINLSNSSPTTLTSIVGGYMGENLWIQGDGNTTMPYLPSYTSTGPGAITCTGHALLLQPGRLYQFEVVGGGVFGGSVVLNELCDSIFEDYLQPGFNWLFQNSGLPVADTQATNDVAGSYSVRPYPALIAPTITTAGAGSSFTYCWAIEFWVAGGKQTSPTACESHTPPVTTGPSDNVIFRLTAPQNWTRYKIYLNSTTDPGFTPGVWYDVTAPNGLPQAATCTIAGDCPLTGLPLEKKTPTDTSTIATANLGLNMTGTYNVSLGGVAVPASSNTLCVQGQIIRDVVGGFDYVCDTEDHWKRAAVTWATF
jgi:hypothetical protein